MIKIFSPFVLILAINAVVGCSSYMDEPSYSELEELAQDQRAQLVAGEEARAQLAAKVAVETREVAEQGIASGPLRSRKPYVGPRLNDPR